MRPPLLALLLIGTVEVRYRIDGRPIEFALVQAGHDALPTPLIPRTERDAVALGDCAAYGARVRVTGPLVRPKGEYRDHLAVETIGPALGSD